MALKFTAITPHSPLFIPTIGKENLTHLGKTLNSYKKIGVFLTEQKIDTTIIFSPHNKEESNLFLLNVAPEFNINFEEFGDFSTKLQIGNDLETSEKIRLSVLESEKMKAINQTNPDFGTSVPAWLLLKEKRNTELIAINTSKASLKEHFETGIAIGKVLEKSSKKIACLASADLSHRLDKHSPAGFSPKGQKFDLRLLDLIHEKRIEDILNLDEATIEDAKPCGLKSIIMLFGILYGAGINWEMATSTYEAPFGVGYLTALLKIKKTTL